MVWTFSIPVGTLTFAPAPAGPIVDSELRRDWPPGSGKTEGIILPWIEGLLKEGNSVVTCDIKGDLVDRLMPVARQIGCRFWYWNCADPARSLAWNWFDEIGEMRDIEAATLSILGRPNLNDAQPYFYERDYRWLRTLIDIVKTAYKGTAIPQYLYTLVGDQNALRALFGQAPKIQSKAGELADLLQFSIDEHSRAVSGLLNSLHLFNLQHVLDVTNRSDFALDDIDKSPTLLIIGASLADARVAEVLSGMMLNQLFNKVYRRFANPRHPGRRSLFFVIDEAPRLKQRIKFDEVLSVSRSADVGICLAAQDVNQFGEEREYTAILANCLSFIAMRGSSIDTARYLSGRLGQRQEQAVGTSTNRGPVDLFSHSGTTRSSVSVPVIGEREIMHPPGSVYTATAHISPVSPKPFLVDLTR